MEQLRKPWEDSTLNHSGASEKQDEEPLWQGGVQLKVGASLVSKIKRYCLVSIFHVHYAGHAKVSANAKSKPLISSLKVHAYDATRGRDMVLVLDEETFVGTVAALGKIRLEDVENDRRADAIADKDTDKNMKSNKGLHRMSFLKFSFLSSIKNKLTLT